jgi:hypothetical protein
MNAENVVLNGLQNRTVVGKVVQQIDYESKILSHVNVIDIAGDTVKIVGLKSNAPKKHNWNYDRKQFGPDDAVTYKKLLTEDDKLIFHSTFSEPIERLAIDPEKLDDALIKQGKKIGSDAAEHLDKEFVEEYACKKELYKTVIEFGPTLMKDVKKIAEITLTTGYDMTRPSGSFNVKDENVNVRNTKKLLCFINTSLLARMEVNSDFGTPSPVLTALEKRFVVIPINMENKCQVALIDSDGVYLARALSSRLIVHDKYVDAHKVLDHLWRMWVVTDFRPMWALFSKDTD